MGQQKQFERVAIVEAGGTENVILESQLMVDYGQGQGPQGGVITVKDGFVTILGPGIARLDGGSEEQGGTFPARLALTGKGKLAVEIVAHEDPTGHPSEATVYLEAASATLRMRDAKGNDHTLLDGANGNLWLGGKKADGDVVLFKEGAKDNRNTDKATIHLDGNAGEITMRDPHDPDHNDHTRLNGAGNLWLGGKKASGDIVLFKEGADNRNTDKATIWLIGDRGKILLGGPNAGGDLLLFRKGTRGDPDTSSATIRLSGEQGDIILQHSDCAEDFDVSESTQIEPGTVMVLDQEGKLEPSTGAYDKKVAGVISGAGEHKPGIVLGKKQTQDHRVPVALVGKVYCKADAQYSAIEVGDLLTTSPTPGHAMKASDPLKAFGAVIGKAMQTLETGQGLIPMLIALQ